MNEESQMQSTGSPTNPNRSDESAGKSGPMLTDAEVICAFMEPRPRGNPYSYNPLPSGKWWTYRWHNKSWMTGPLTLNECHEVEARLTDEQWWEYRRVLVLPEGEEARNLRQLIHATAEQKIKALTVALRSRVLSKEDAEGAKACQPLSEDMLRRGYR